MTRQLGAEKWSQDHKKGKFVYRQVEKLTDSKNLLGSFRSTTKNNVIAEKPFQNSGVARRL